MVEAAAAVVGSSGFLGRHLVTALRAARVPTTTLTRANPPLQRGRLCPRLRSVSTVYFLAGTGTPAGMERDPSLAAEELAALRALLSALSLRSRPPVLVLAGSGGVVYDSALPPPYQETTPTAPSTEYGRLKLAEERLLRACTSWSPPPVHPVVLRLANVYGPGQRAGTGQGVIAHWLHAASRREPFEVFGDPDSVRDYLYIDDAVAAFVQVHLRGVGRTGAPALLNIGSGVPTTLRELTALVLRVTGARLADVRAHPPRAVDRRASWLDIERARAVMGWRPTVPLATGLARTWRDLTGRPVTRAGTSAGRGCE